MLGHACAAGGSHVHALRRSEEEDVDRREANVAAAVAKRFNGKVAAKSEAPAPASAPLSSSATT